MPNSGNFEKGNVPWNKNKKGYTNKKSKPVLQFDLNTGNTIQEFKNCRLAAEYFNCSQANIRNAILGKSKSAKGFGWKFKHK